MSAPTKPPTVPTVPQNDLERLQAEEINRRLRELGQRFKQRNLENAVKLAAEAARGRGELVEHFAELGRRFGGTTVKSRRAHLRVVEGGEA